MYDRKIFRSSSEVFCNFGNLRIVSKSVLKNVHVAQESIGEYLKIFGKWSEIFQNRQKRRNVYAYIMNKTMHVACRYGISVLVFNFLVQLSRVSCAHSWDLTCGDIEFKTWSVMHICIILEEMHVELVLFHCILLSYPSCLFRQFPTRSKFTDRTQSLKIFAEWLSGLMEKMAHKLN